MAISQEPWLKKIQIRRYRSCQSTTFTPHRTLSVLIGINGSGKTNLLSAIRLLALHGRRYPGRRAVESEVGTETELEATFVVGKHEVVLRRRMRLDTSSRHAEEIISAKDQWNFRYITGSKAWHTIPDWYAHEHVSTAYIDYRLKYELPRPQYRVLARILKNKAAVRAVRAIVSYRRRIAYYSASQFTDPSRCPVSLEIEQDPRGTEQFTPPRLSYGQSRPHWQFIQDLYLLQSSNQEAYKAYIDFVSRDRLGLVSKITWKKVTLSSSVVDVKQGGKVRRGRKQTTLVIPKAQIGSSHLTFNQLSEGTFKTLALIFYIMTDASRCLILEEPEVCVHHGLLTKVIDIVKAHSFDKQIFVSTHSDQILDQLAVANVFVVEMKRGGTSVKDLQSWLRRRDRSALNVYLSESGTLGEYWKAGGFS